MKKVIYILFCVLISTLCTFASETELYGIGAKLIKDPFSKRTFILEVLPETNARKAGLPVGGEIISVDNIKTKSQPIEDIIKMIKGEKGTTVNLLVKYNKKKTNYEITREKININPHKTDKMFDLHWRQVVPEIYEKTQYIPISIASRTSKKYYYQVVLPVNYWADRKSRFKIGYEVCKEYPKSDQNSCFMNLVNREIAKTDNDRQIEIQQEMAYQQARQNFINSMHSVQTNNNLNNINNSIQQQNMYLNNINNSLRNW